MTRRALVAGSALVVFVCGCSSSSPKTAPTTTAKPSASTTSRPATTSSSSPKPPTSFPGPALESLVLKDAPSGYPRRADSLADTGPTRLEKAALEDPLNDLNDARQTLRAAGFLRGYQRQWSTGDTIGQNFIFLYQFATRAGALAYVAHWRTAVIADASGTPPVPFTSLVPGAIGLQSKSDRASSGVVLFAKGVYAVQAVATGGPGRDPRPPTNSLAFAQYALLP
ncbi:MAG TPA: hypothetical protein VL769_04545 [Acidimicrobiia bacterium]|nr:hypothetical protein [Acidimicrobiia bacterium]